MKKSTIFVISGPSGAGKSSVISAWLKAQPDLKSIRSVTTRKPRNQFETEKYQFISKAEFSSMVKNNELIEWINPPNDAFYGTPKEAFDNLIAAGNDIVLEYIPPAYLTLKQHFPLNTVGIFLTPPTFAKLNQQINDRCTESEAEIAIRMNMAKQDYFYMNNHDYIVVNEDVQKSAKKLASIREAESCLVKNNTPTINSFSKDKVPSLISYYSQTEPLTV